MTTICGKKATRRIEWFNPKAITTVDGKKRVDVIVFAVAMHAGWKLVHVGSQFGLDMRGRRVLPHSVVAELSDMKMNDPAFTVYGWYINAEVGKLEETAHAMLKQLQLGDRQQWFAPAGLVRGHIKLTPKEIEVVA